MDECEDEDYPRTEKADRGHGRAQKDAPTASNHSRTSGHAASAATVNGGTGADDVDVPCQGSVVYATRPMSSINHGRKNLARLNGAGTGDSEQARLADTEAEDFYLEEEEEEVVLEGRELLARFIVAELEKEGKGQLVEQNGRSQRQQELVRRRLRFAPSARTASSLMQQDKIVDALGRIGDAMERDRELNSMIASVPPDATWETFCNVARNLFAREINWGRIVALFYFACRMVRRNLDSMPVVSHILDWTAKLIKVYVAHWVISRGGWRSVVEWFGPAWSQIGGAFMAFGFLCVACYGWKACR